MRIFHVIPIELLEVNSDFLVLRPVVNLIWTSAHDLSAIRGTILILVLEKMCGDREKSLTN